ncbi:MAG: GtrA family protein [Anaerolineaceae bacterium]|nr:GtrA family protein [Anaerolineaceae bacterium]
MNQYNSTVDEVSQNTTKRGFRNPLDTIIEAVARRIGGSKAKEVERFLRFAFVGMVGAVVDFGTVFILQATFLPPTNQKPIDVNVVIATSIAFLAAVVSNFFWNRYWTYPDSRSRSIRRQLVMFTFISLVGWLGRTVWINVAYTPLGDLVMPIALPVIQIFRPNYVPSVTASAKLGTMVAMLIGIVVVMFWNFIANRIWTYNDVD